MQIAGTAVRLGLYMSAPANGMRKPRGRHLGTSNGSFLPATSASVPALNDGLAPDGRHHRESPEDAAGIKTIAR